MNTTRFANPGSRESFRLGQMVQVTAQADGSDDQATNLVMYVAGTSGSDYALAANVGDAKAGEADMWVNWRRCEAI